MDQCDNCCAFSDDLVRRDDKNGAYLNLICRPCAERIAYLLGPDFVGLEAAWDDAS